MTLKNRTAWLARYCAGWCAIAMIASWGCTDGKQVIEGRTITSGTVTFDGQPLRGGTVTFTSKENSILSTATNIRAGGKYRTDRAPAGKNLVSIETESLQWGNEGAYIPIPSKYNSPATSGLEVDLKPGENEKVDFALKAQSK
ncbi:MAG TPA: hypothetical protein VJ828_15750 [Lacipirellulaceae bacterium]|nr:hypothetical protein [Lacipirellulaceae bacterium]